MAETSTMWDAAEHLRTPEDARLYLQACADEDPGGGSGVDGAAQPKLALATFSGPEIGAVQR